MKGVSGIGLGGYISRWWYVYDEEKEKLGRISIDSGNGDSVDVEGLEENRDMFLEWGYIFSDGRFVWRGGINMKVRDLDCMFDCRGRDISMKCMDGRNDVRFMGGDKGREDRDDRMVKLLDWGCGLNVGVIIERFE